MKTPYFIYYDACNREEEIILAKSEEDAIAYAYEKAIEDYNHYEGFHGILSREDIAEEYNLDPDEDEEEIENLYRDNIESTIYYGASIFDEQNEYHQMIFEVQDFKPYEI